MNLPECCKTPWVNELREAVEAYISDDSSKNFARCRCLIMTGIMNNESLPIPGKDDEHFYTAKNTDGEWLYSNLGPVEDIPDIHATTMIDCLELIDKYGMRGLVIAPMTANIRIAYDELCTMLDALYGPTDDDEDEAEEPEEPDEEEDEPEDDEDDDGEEAEGPENEDVFDDMEKLEDNEVIMSRFLVTRPLPEGHFEPIQYALSGLLDPDGGTVLVQFVNGFGDDDLLAARAFHEGERFHVQLFYDMEDFGWKTPLVLGNDDFGPQETIRLFRALCCTDMQTGDMPRIMRSFCDETKKVYKDA